MMNRIMGTLAAAALLTSPALAGTLTTTYDMNGAADGMMFDLTAKKTITLTGWDFRSTAVGPNVFTTIEVYYVTDRTSYVGKETDPSLWTLMGTETVAALPYPPAVHVNVGGLSMQPRESIGIYFTDINVAPSNVARRSGPLGAFENDDLIFEDRGVAKYYPFGATFTPRVWCGTIHYDVLAAPCPEDVNGDATVDVLDLLMVLAAWGNTSGPEDINGDGIVDVQDLLALLAAWGPC
jgi:hypothetical protein